MKKQILNILPYIASGFLLLASGCTDEQSGIPVASGTPLTITAEIGTSASPSSTDRLGDAAPANDSDLSKTAEEGKGRTEKRRNLEFGT